MVVTLSQQLLQQLLPRLLIPLLLLTQPRCQRPSEVSGVVVVSVVEAEVTVEIAVVATEEEIITTKIVITLTTLTTTTLTLQVLRQTPTQNLIKGVQGQVRTSQTTHAPGIGRKVGLRPTAQTP